MKILFTLLLFSFGIILVNAQSAHPEKQPTPEQKSKIATQQEPVQKTNNDVVAPKRVVQPAPAPEKKTIEFQQEKKAEQTSPPSDPNQPKRVPSQVKADQELSKQQLEYEQLKKTQPE